MTSTRRQQAARRKEKQTGSPIIGEPVFVLVGILRRPHGLKGEAVVSLDTDFPERLKIGTRLFMGDDHRPVTIASRRPHNQGLLLAFEELPDMQSLESLRNQPLFVATADRPPLAPGEYYQHELLGMQVFEEDDKPLGILAQILETGANNVFVVRTADEKEVLLPAIPDVIRHVDVAERRMIVHVLPGLRDLADASLTP